VTPVTGLRGCQHVGQLYECLTLTRALSAQPCDNGVSSSLQSSYPLPIHVKYISTLYKVQGSATSIMSARHFINDPSTAVLASLESLALADSSLAFDRVNKIIYRSPSSLSSSDQPPKVCLVSGGGSGHEPAWAGFVGQGFLTAAVAGTVFASPGAEQIRTCLTKRLPEAGPGERGDKGILVLVKNYTGDVLNFGMAVEKTRASGRRVEMIVIADDVGVGRAKSGKVGRRGIAGSVLVVKICGALAEFGASLEDVARVGRLVSDGLVSVAVSLGRVHVLGRPEEDAREEEQRLRAGQVEVGMGIHNEPGCMQMENDLDTVVDTMLKQLLDDSDEDRGYVKWGREDRFVLLINNFGGLSNLELGGITTTVCHLLDQSYGIRPTRIISGTFVGSLNGLGFSISLLKLQDTGLGKGMSMVDLLDAPTSCPAWPIATQAPNLARGEGVQGPRDGQETSEDVGRVMPSNLQGKARYRTGKSGPRTVSLTHTQ